MLVISLLLQVAGAQLLTSFALANTALDQCLASFFAGAGMARLLRRARRVEVRRQAGSYRRGGQKNAPNQSGRQLYSNAVVFTGSALAARSSREA